MSYTKLEINLRKLEFNARMEVQKLAEYGVTVMDAKYSTASQRQP